MCLATVAVFGPPQRLHTCHRRYPSFHKARNTRGLAENSKIRGILRLDFFESCGRDVRECHFNRQLYLVLFKEDAIKNDRANAGRENGYLLL